jgi:hypothetical protein
MPFPMTMNADSPVALKVSLVAGSSRIRIESALVVLQVSDLMSAQVKTRPIVIQTTGQTVNIRTL